MTYEVEVTDEFQAWWHDQDEDLQFAIDQRVRYLEAQGPRARRPVVGEIKGSRHDPRMKELIVGSIRILFMFDPRSIAVLLHAGDKSDDQLWNDWYQSAIPTADDLYEVHLREIADAPPA